MTSYFVTTALPYANGALHLGHLIEMIEADIWVRAQRAQGVDVVFVSGDDSHGTPIMLHARKNGIQPSESVSMVNQQHRATIQKYHIGFDHFGRTDSAMNQKYCEEIFHQLMSAGIFQEQMIEQFFDPQEQMFLPDRFVKGTCPRCGAHDQCGDHCDACGATYDPKTLISPYSAISGATPVLKSVSHLFLNLDQDRLWLQEILPGKVDDAVLAKLMEWLREPLKPWDITRDAPYYGFQIPGRDQQYFYVWFDAPIGYLSLFEEITGRSLQSDPERKMIHFIGKDISYFHSIFWPVVLKHAGFALPEKIAVHGFLTLSGQKMSKSRGISCDPMMLADAIDPELVRYVLASKMHGKIEDMNFDLTETVQKINSDLVGKSLNILSRCAKLLYTYRDGLFEPETLKEFNFSNKFKNEISQDYFERSYSVAISKIMREMQVLNEELTIAAPWTALKNDPQDLHSWKVLSHTLLQFFEFMRLLAPIMPNFVEKVLGYQGTDRLTQEYTPLLYRLDEKVIGEKMNMNSESNQQVIEKSTTEVSTIKPYITLEDFDKVDLRVGQVNSASRVEGSDKLLSLKVNIGEKEIQIFSGIAADISPESLVNQLVVVCVNLQPRKMRFGVSEGMLISAKDGVNPLSAIGPLTTVQPGSKLA